MNKLKFKQDVGEFFGSKSNWLCLITIGSGAVGFMAGLMNPLEAYFTITGGFMGITFRDAIAGV